MNIPMKIYLLLLTCLFLLPTVVFSANLIFDTEKKNFGLGEEFLVNVMLNTEGISVNAVEGKIIFPSQLLEIKEIRDGNSAVNFWIERPEKSKIGELTFSGITPGGLSGSKVFLYSIVFQSKLDGEGAIKTSQLVVLQNDGKGTKTDVSPSSFPFIVSKEPGDRSTVERIVDNEKPEDFTPAIESNIGMFDGKYFLVFSTQDKGSGIAEYQVREGWFSFYKKADSPYLIKNQSLNKKIYVKAIDKYGNERVAILKTQNTSPWYKQYKIFAIIFIIIVSFILFRRKWLSFLQK